MLWLYSSITFFDSINEINGDLVGKLQINYRSIEFCVFLLEISTFWFDKSVKFFWRIKVRIISAYFLFVFLNAQIISYSCKLRTRSLLSLQCSFLFPDEVHLVLADSGCVTEPVHVCQKPNL